MPESPITPVPFDGKDFVRTLTGAPGVYRMFGAADELLYVGKAGNLKKRVGSYFLKPRMEPRIAAMVAQIARIETTRHAHRGRGAAARSAADQVAEAALQHPAARRQELSVHPPDRRATSRASRSTAARAAGGGRYFGPFPSAGAVRESLDLIQKLFQHAQLRGQLLPQPLAAVPAVPDRPLQRAVRRPGLGAPTTRENVRHAAMFLDGRGDAMMRRTGRGDGARQRASSTSSARRSCATRSPPSSACRRTTTCRARAPTWT